MRNSPGIMVWMLLTLVVLAARADDSVRLAELDRLLAEGQAAAAATAAAADLDGGNIDPRNVWRFRQRLGVALVADGQPAEAVAVLELAVIDAPQEPALHLNLGRALRDLGHGGRAVSEFGLAVGLAPQRYRWRLEYAEALLSLGVRRDALGQIRSARAICGDCPEALRGEVNYHLATGRLADAVEPLRALQICEPSPDTRRLLVRTLWNLDDPAGVVAVLDTVPEAQLDGEDLALLLDADRRLGRAERARRWVRENAEAVQRVARPTAQVWALISEICLGAGAAGDALVAIDRAVALDPGNAVYHNNRAAVLVALGREDDARRALAESQRLGAKPGGTP